MTPGMTISKRSHYDNAVWRLQSAAWAAWNASHFAEPADAYREAGRSLYQQAISERIAALFARLDEQNDVLDAIGPLAEATANVTLVPQPRTVPAT